MKKILVILLLNMLTLFALNDIAKISLITNYIVDEEVSKYKQKHNLPNRPQTPIIPKSISLVKGEFEAMDSFNMRVLKATQIRDKQIETIQGKYNILVEDYNTQVHIYQENIQRIMANMQALATRSAIEIVYGDPKVHKLVYNPEQNQFSGLLESDKGDFSQKILINVPQSQAELFTLSEDAMEPEITFSFKDSILHITAIKIHTGDHEYSAKLADNAFEQKQVQVNISGGHFIFDGLKIAKRKKGFIDDLGLIIENTEVVEVDETKWAFIIGIEKYEYTDNITFASRSAQSFKNVVQKTLGVPESNTYMLMNEQATLSRIKSNFKRMLRNIKEGDTVYFYYNGHGVPIPEQKNKPYILASDVDLDFITDDPFFSLDSIYDKLSKSKADKVFAFVDSCFSGQTDGKAIVKGVAATRLQAKSVSFNKQKMVVLTAGKATQYSNAYNKRGHRLFSYYILEALLGGEKNIMNLYNKVYSKVKKTSFSDLGDLRLQEPVINGNIELEL